MQTRREFLGTLGIGALGAAALACTRSNGQPATPPTRMPLGIQLYTLRSLLERDFDGTLASVAAIGYREVEFAGYYNRTPAQVRELLARTGLSAPSAHLPLPASDDAWARALADAKAVGHEWAVIPWLDQSLRRTPDDWARFADRLNHLAPMAKSAGLRFGYHNHDFELASSGSGTFLDLLLTRTDPQLVSFEMDVYWVTKAGADPLALLAKYPGRFPLLHLKDATAAPERRMVDVGSGTIGWPALLTAARGQGLQHAFVEHDQPADPLASARASYTYLSTQGF
ncbi:MAG TPA: sugar phosphate isomerase/epimerase [Gemmatimonadaceae bacterium]|nr:sugar phosphate isomerase/epimerase [Gemmatimonadaceae bacterium]